MKRIVSIIHGANRILRSSKNEPSWSRELQKYMLNNGLDYAAAFNWSGNWYDAFRFQTAEAYARHITDLLSQWPDEKIHLSIWAKSLGAIVAERGLGAMHKWPPKRVELISFVRVATPDKRRSLPLPVTGRVTNVISSSDMLYRLYAPVVTIMLQLAGKHHGIPTCSIRTIRIPSLSHSDFNEDRALDHSTTSQSSLYKLYNHLLLGRS